MDLTAVLAELIRALWHAALPVGITSYLLVWWALRRNYLGAVADMNDIKNEIKRQAKAKKNKKKKEEPEIAVLEAADEPAFDPVHNKWLAFGGGFYGVVALLTYLVVELAEIRDFFASVNSISSLLTHLEPGMLIDLLIDSIVNFIAALVWPVYWLSEIDSDQIWIWFLAAYAGYWAGARLALRQARRQAGSDTGL